MEVQHVNVKVFVDGELRVDPARFIEVFHRWVRDQVLDELLIDVADYRHVPAGPTVLLVGLASDYSLDNTGNRYGLRYNRKWPLEGTNEDRIAQALCAAARVCRMLESELEADGPLRFSRHELELSINDRALAPNTPETYEACKPVFESALAQTLCHNDFKLTHDLDDPRRRFTVSVQAAQPFDFSTALGPTP
jgi:hypothetical protein